MSRRDSRRLEQLIGAEALVRLADAHGGTRFYVPAKASLMNELVGRAAAKALAETFGGLVVHVPLVRELRARHHRANGMSNAQIARHLGMTERAVERIFATMDNPPAKGSAVQGDLFT